MDLVQVENMRRPAQLEHHVVRNIHQRRHAALAATRKPVHHPGRGGRLCIDVAHDAAGEAAAQVRRADPDRQLVRAGHSNRRKGRGHQGRTGQRGHFTGNAVHAQAMREIGRELESEQGVIELQVLTDVLAHGRVWRQLEQPAMVVGQLEFAGRAQHALALHAAQLADLDQERFTVVARRQFGTDQRTRHLDTDTGIGRAADDVEQGALPHIDQADTQAVGIGMLHRFPDFADDDLAERRRNRLEVFHLQASHGQGLGQLFGAQGRIAEFAQPGFGKLHFL